MKVRITTKPSFFWNLVLLLVTRLVGIGGGGRIRDWGKHLEGSSLTFSSNSAPNLKIPVEKVPSMHWHSSKYQLMKQAQATWNLFFSYKYCISLRYSIPPTQKTSSSFLSPYSGYLKYDLAGDEDVVVDAPATEM